MSELRLRCTARKDRPKPMRHALGAFLEAIDVDSDVRDDILTAVGEALANAAEHAYSSGSPGDIELFARVEDDDSTLLVDVVDSGAFIEKSESTPNRGFGLRIIRAIARAVSLEYSDGTRIHMIFDAKKTAA
jgi:anti-sigma regulatory factor (Ser/Thr protein kinase)